jgi:glycosyltransferase involved in cell wall biosynthesis
MVWLADKLVNAGDSVCLLTEHKTSEDFYPLNPAVTRITFEGNRRYFDSSAASVPVNKWRWRQALRTAARRQRSDVVLSFIDRTNISVLLAFAGSGIPVVVSERLDPRYSDMHRFDLILRPYVYRYLAHKVVVQTEAIASHTRTKWGLRAVVVVPNAPGITAASSNQANRPLRVLSVGRLARQKGHDLLIDAWARIAPQFPNWHLRIVGEGPERGRLEDQVARLGIASSVSLPGMVDDVASEYRAAPIFVLPSRFEGFPNALLEAMACGCAPIATTDAGASVDLIESGVNGTLVAGQNVNAMATALGDLMHDSALRDTYAAEAAKVASHYDPDRIFELWRRVLLDGAGLN